MSDAIADMNKESIGRLLEGYTWLHLSGIIPVLSEDCRKLVRNSLKIARDKGIMVSFVGGDAFANGLIYAMMN